ncbi:MAG TPA: proton-conducting transporter membrane subunit [Rectinemataceae bacterium]|nr:proton-conducting transporter membrane subunit [Rectinemataceae bacterium]
MPDPALILAIIGAGLAAASSVPALFLRRGSRAGQNIALVAMFAAAGLGIGGAIMALASAASGMAIGGVGAGDGSFGAVSLPWKVFGAATLRIDPLSAFFLIPLFLVGALGALYGSSYRDVSRNRRSSRRQLAFWGLLVAGMAILLLAADAPVFILGWECMALSAFFLMTLDDEREEARRAGFVYLAATHAGTLILFAFFALWRHFTGSFAFVAPASGMLPPESRNLLFLLALVVFSLKAGVMPLHFWLPGAHANAPSHVSAILSGVVLKMGVYGIMRFAFLLGPPPPLWGQTLLLLGAASSILGVAFAIAQHDIKRLLAYHSVENIGIILMGFGLALTGMSRGRGLVAALGMGAALLHVWNHAIFKTLLFFGAGSVVERTGTRQLDRLGGLARVMPWTAAFFLVGAVAISGIPPFNGFMSEFILYFGAFAGARPGGLSEASALLVVPALAATGALALACFVKVYGVAFLGQPRSVVRPKLRESPPSMIVPMAVLAALCLLIGVEPRVFASALDAVIASLPLGADVGNSGILTLAPLAAIGRAGMVLALVVAVFALISMAVSAKRRAKTKVGTWDCGYAAPDARMQYGASSFGRPIGSLFGWILRPTVHGPKVDGAFPAESHLESHVDEVSLDRLVLPLVRVFERRALWIRRFQQGLTQRYLLYILVTVLILLGTLIPFGDFIASLLSG